jgi:hypothetical protein
VKLWLDDTRPSPKGWLWVKTAPEAIEKLKSNQVTNISLDYVLGPMSAGNGYDVAKYIKDSAKNKSLRKLEWSIHSIHPDGCYRMEVELYAADRHWKNK